MWKTANSFRSRKGNSEIPIIKSEWENFYEENLSETREKLITYTDTSHEHFDVPFSFQELSKAMKKFSNNKAPGLDGVPIEFFKFLPQKWKEYLLSLYNLIMIKEEIPVEWSTIETVMLFKKGERSNPANYRGISLLNVMLKIFTQMLLNRIQDYSENNILPECQAGFRPGRGCADHIFTLSSIINLTIQKK